MDGEWLHNDDPTIASKTLHQMQNHFGPECAATVVRQDLNPIQNHESREISIFANPLHDTLFEIAARVEQALVDAEGAIRGIEKIREMTASVRETPG